MLNFTLPSLGADMDQGKLVQWKIAPGDSVKRGQIVAVIETSKAAVDVEIWLDGIVHELLVEPGTMIPVGTVLATLLEPGETAEVKNNAAAVTATTAPTPETVPRRTRISPLARKRAIALDLDIRTLTGSGPDGTITLDDVERAANLSAPAPAPDRQAEMRKAIAAAMSRSKREIPHYYLSETVPMRQAQTWLTSINKGRAITDRILMAAVQLKAVALALKKFPDMNGFFTDGAYQPSSAIHIGVAISLRQGGLIAPAVHDAADKRLETIMRDLMDLVKRARAGSLRSSEMTDPTITVTNIGEQGVESVHGIIYPPQVALVGFGRIAERPWVENGAICAQPLMTASLAADHRVSDGHRGALFLAAIRDLLQTPEEL